eukprot:scaffold89993_cov17-Tisochrysis_lutea.AAC.1
MLYGKTAKQQHAIVCGLNANLRSPGHVTPQSLTLQLWDVPDWGRGGCDPFEVNTLSFLPGCEWDWLYCIPPNQFIQLGLDQRRATKGKKIRGMEIQLHVLRRTFLEQAC